MTRCSGIQATHQARRDTVLLWANAPQKKRGGRNRILNVPPDVFDLRDRQYQPQLTPLPERIPVPREAAARRVRDQLSEGACTGFAMAAVVNHLMAARGRRFDASARFLYENAKRYDEWKGEEYEGSSIRGAMKGFLKHGVCPWSDMPYRPGEAYTRIPPGALAAAGERPLGAYFRVSTSSINDLQSAIAETGIVLVSAQVHRGWNAPRPPAAKRGAAPAARAKPLARIAWRASDAPEGGHAFVLVGYERDGFIVQNSWGTGWGSGGFALLGYDDWLVHRMDAWVCQLGVGSVQREVSMHGTRRVSPGTVAHVDDEDIRGHYLAIRNGVFDDAAPFRSGAEDLTDLAGRIARHASTKGTAQKPASLMLFAHGGLVDENGAAARTLEGMRQFLPHGVYPLHFIWHTGMWETATDLLFGQQRKVGPVAGEERVQGWLKDKLIEAKDETLELAVRLPGRPVWEEMKGDALEAVHGPDAQAADVAAGGGCGPAWALMDAIHAACAAAAVKLRWHLVAHSAGSIFHCRLLEWFVRRGVKVDSCSFIAPAVTCELFRGTVMANASVVRRFGLHTMPDRDERDDHCMRIYSKSLLYLVSEAFERRVHEPLLGLARNVDRDWKGRTNDVDAAVRTWLQSNATLDFHRPVLRDATLHGSFDDDPATLDAVLARMA